MRVVKREFYIRLSFISFNARMSDKNKLNHKYARKVVLTNCKNSHEVYPPAIRRVDTSVAP